MSKQALIKFLKANRKVIALIIVGTIAWSLTMVKSGLVYSFGAGFWGPNGHDGIWHVALIESLARGNLNIPVFAGETIQNYHIGFDLLVAVIHKLTFIPVSILYFQLIPPILAIFAGWLTYKLVLKWKKSKHAAFWATFFVYFGGSFGWLLTLLRDSTLSGESLFWSQQSLSTLINPPFALSFVLMLAGLILVIDKSNNKKRNLMLATFLFGILIQVKVYAGILSLGGLFMAGIYRLIKRRGADLIKVFSGALIISILLFSPLNKASAETIVYQPFWFLETMMAVADRVYWPKFYEAMINYRWGNIWLKAIPAYSATFLLFLVGNMGTRIIKAPLVLRWIKDFKNLRVVELFFLSIIPAGIVIPMFFVQSGTPWNTIQFVYYSLMFSGILAGVSLGDFLKRRKTTIRSGILIIVIVVFAIPTTIATLRHYLPSRPPAKLSQEELKALQFLSRQPQGVILTYPYDKDKAEAAADNPPRPLYLYESTAYVSAYSKKDVYLEDEVNLDITGYDWRQRRENVLKFLQSQDHEYVRSFLRDNDIAYVYWVKGQRATLGESQLGLERIYENSEVDIFKVIENWSD